MGFSFEVANYEIKHHMAAPSCLIREVSDLGGVLDFKVDTEDFFIKSLVSKYEKLSARTCQMCGGRAHLCTSPYLGTKTICKRCSQESPDYRNAYWVCPDWDKAQVELDERIQEKNDFYLGRSVLWLDSVLDPALCGIPHAAWVRTEVDAIDRLGTGLWDIVSFSSYSEGLDGCLIAKYLLGMLLDGSLLHKPHTIYHSPDPRDRDSLSHYFRDMEVVVGCTP